MTKKMMTDLMLSLLRKFHIGRSFYIAESYGYTFVCGKAEGDNRYLVMCNLEDLKFVEVKPNTYFGCQAEIRTIDYLRSNKTYKEALGDFIIANRDVFEKSLQE